MIVILITSAFSHQENCRRYVVVTQPSSDPTHTCNIALNQLIVLQNDLNRFLVRHFITRAMKIEVMFQSGVHQVAEMAGCQPLPFRYFDKVVITGQPNVTFDCLNRVFIYFDNVPKFKIQNMKFQNYICNQGFGIVFNTMNLPISAATILNSKFINSRLIILNDWRNNSVKSVKEIIVISNVLFEDCCNSSSVVPILYMNHSSGFLGFTLHGIIVRNNIAPFLIIIRERHVVTSIALIGHNLFTSNSHPIFIVLCSSSNDDFCTLRFFNTTVHFTNNTINHESRLNSPVTMLSGRVHFKHSHVIFNNNQGDFNGVFLAQHSKIIFGDNVYLNFSNNIGKNGGALSLDSNSTIIFNASKSGVSLHFVNNIAHKGGAILVEDVIQSGPFSIMDKYNLILKQIPSLRSITIHIIDDDDSLLYEADHALTKIII